MFILFKNCWFHEEETLINWWSSKKKTFVHSLKWRFATWDDISEKFGNIELLKGSFKLCTEWFDIIEPEMIIPIILCKPTFILKDFCIRNYLILYKSKIVRSWMNKSMEWTAINTILKDEYSHATNKFACHREWDE